MDSLDNPSSACDVTHENEVNAASSSARFVTSPIDFMKAIMPNGLWCLSAINPAKKGHIVTQTFAPETEAAARAWVEGWIGKWNLYFTVNGLRQPMSKKPEGADIASLDFLHVDIDPRTGEDLVAERQRILALLTTNLPEGVPQPTIVISSGGGYQAFWKLETPLELDGSEAEVEMAKLWNVHLERLFKADNCHNIDRIMRLPETINVPDEKKRKKGRAPAPTYIVDMDLARVYPLSIFKAAKPQTGRSVTALGAVAIDLSAGEIKLADVHDLDRHTSNGKPLEDRVKRIIQVGYDEFDDQPDGKPKSDRSRWVIDVTCALVRRGVPDNVIMAVLLDRGFRISDHIYDQKQSEKYAIRQIKRAKEFVIDPALAELNELHAVLLQEGGKTRVLSWETSELDANLEVPVLQSFEDFQKRYMNRAIDVGLTESGKQKHVKLGRWWLEHPQRREYKALRFLPGRGEVHDGYLNLWQGFGVEAAPGRWNLMRQHVQEILAGGDDTVADYILKWTAWSVQNPDKPAEVALVLRGGRGTGKSTYARWLKRLFGHHGLQVTSSMQLTGRFNRHLRSCCLLFADEAIAPNDKNGESILKGLITEPEVIIEGKGLDAVQARNHLHIVMASNEKWVVPSGIDERRFAVFEVSNGRVGDKAYFSALEAEMTSGGQAAMLYDLLSLDLKGWHPRDAIPQTKALAEQKAQSLRGFERIMFDLLKAGLMPVEAEPADVHNGTQKVRTMILKAYAKREWPREHVTLNSVADVLITLGWEQYRGAYRGFFLPTLPQARAMWSAKYFEVAWDNTTTWEMIGTDLEGRPEVMFETPPPLKVVTLD